MINDITILNFTGAYENQDLYTNPDFRVIECKDIEGTNGYCDDAAADMIRERFRDASVKGVHFIDAGNYHYLSKFMVERIDEPFTLVVFDHHSDMKESEFFGLLSCGSWILDVVNTNANVKRVVLIGISDEQRAMIPEVDKEMIIYTDKEIRQSSNVEIPGDYSVYISIDKDVLDETLLNEGINIWQGSYVRGKYAFLPDGYAPYDLLLHVVDLKKKQIIKTKNLNDLVDEPEGIDIHGKWVYVVFHTSGKPRHSKLYRFNLK